MATRKVELFKDGEWKQILMQDLKAGDKFRMFESSGEPVTTERGDAEFIAEGDAYKNKRGIWTIEIK